MYRRSPPRSGLESPTPKGRAHAFRERLHVFPSQDIHALHETRRTDQQAYPQFSPQPLAFGLKRVVGFGRKDKGRLAVEITCGQRRTECPRSRGASRGKRGAGRCSGTASLRCTRGSGLLRRGRGGWARFPRGLLWFCFSGRFWGNASLRFDRNRLFRRYGQRGRSGFPSCKRLLVWSFPCDGRRRFGHRFRVCRGCRRNRAGLPAAAPRRPEGRRQDDARQHRRASLWLVHGEEPGHGQTMGQGRNRQRSPDHRAPHILAAGAPTHGRTPTAVSACRASDSSDRLDTPQAPTRPSRSMTRP